MGVDAARVDGRSLRGFGGLSSSSTTVRMKRSPRHSARLPGKGAAAAAVRADTARIVAHDCFSILANHRAQSTPFENTRETLMDTDALVSFVIVIIFGAVLIYPFFRIFQRTGISGWWALLMLIPLLNIAVLWIFAFARWPALDLGFSWSESAWMDEDHRRHRPYRSEPPSSVVIRREITAWAFRRPGPPAITALVSYRVDTGAGERVRHQHPDRDLVNPEIGGNGAVGSSQHVATCLADRGDGPSGRNPERSAPDWHLCARHRPAPASSLHARSAPTWGWWRRRSFLT